MSLHAAARLLPFSNPLLQIVVGQVLVHGIFARFAPCGRHGHEHAPVTGNSALSAWRTDWLMITAHLVAAVLALPAARHLETAVARAGRYVIDRVSPRVVLRHSTPVRSGICCGGGNRTSRRRCGARIERHPTRAAAVAQLLQRDTSVDRRPARHAAAQAPPHGPDNARLSRSSPTRRRSTCRDLQGEAGRDRPDGPTKGPVRVGSARRGAPRSSSS